MNEQRSFTCFHNNKNNSQNQTLKDSQSKPSTELSSRHKVN